MSLKVYYNFNTNFGFSTSATVIQEMLCKKLVAKGKF